MSHRDAYVREAGAGDPVICIHASASSSAQWRPLIDRLAGRFRTLAVDLYGCGRSPDWRGDRPLSLADEVALLEPVLAATGARFHLIGHSYGGAVALKVALAHPGWLASLVLFEPVLFSVLMAQDPDQPAAREIDAVRAGTSAAADRGDLAAAAARFVDYWMGAGAWAAMPETRRQTVAAAMGRIKGQWHAAFEEPAPLPAFAALDVPTLCLVGSDSPASSRAVSRLLAKTMPRATEVDLYGVGHMGPVTHPDRVNTLIEAHLDGRDRFSQPSHGRIAHRRITMGAVQTKLDQAKVEEFFGKVVQDVAATLHAGLVLIGDKLGLYRAMADAGPLTPADLAKRTGAHERYVREWLSAQAAGGYVTYDPVSGRFTLPPEHAFLLLDADLPGAFQLGVGSVRDEPKIADAFRTGAGVGWHEHDAGVYEGCERFFRPGYAMHLTSQWIPALDGVKERLEAGGKVADVGCGHGASSIIMAQAFPHSTLVGFDYHPASIEWARRAADKAGVGDRVSFEVAAAKDYPGAGYDLVTFFDCLHDMGDPVGAARHVRGSLAPGGTWMLVEPLANDRLEDNLNPVGRLYYSASTLLCTPASLSQEVGLALGAQAGEKRLREVLTEAGFTRVRRVAQTPANMILEVRA